MLQTDRRTNPYPTTWEIPVGAVAIVVVLAVLGIHLGRGAASWFAGTGFVWPSNRALFTSLPEVASGHPVAGLAAGTPVAASPAAIIGCIITVELLVVAASITAAVFVLRRWGPGRMRGMASPAEAEAILGLARLRKTARIIRPDLYGTKPTIHTEGGHDGYHPSR